MPTSQDITGFADFKNLLESTIQETETYTNKYSEMKIYSYILAQLHHIKSVLVYEGRKPTFNETQSIDMGAVALKNFDDDMPEYSDKIKTIAYVFRNTDEAKYLDQVLRAT